MPAGPSFWERSRDYVLLLTLLAVSAGMYVTRDGPALRAARAASLHLTAPVETLFARAGHFRRALGENERLRAEAIALSAEVARLREARLENERLRALLGAPDSLGIPRVIARVVSKDFTEQANLLTINVGTAQGVREGMPVVDERGVVGKIVLAGPRYSVVMPHQNTQFAVPALVDAIGQDGLVRWDGVARDRLVMEYVTRTEQIERGMLVTTSAFSGIFPPGLPIGRVDTAFAARGRNDYIIYLQPAAPISQVNFVYVLLVEPDAQRARLEEAARDTLGL
ncbi:MAG: rod shape-determining protein MreC [Rubricoccaceae bacterium]